MASDENRTGPRMEEDPGYVAEIHYLPQGTPRNDEAQPPQLPPDQFVEVSSLQLEHLPAPIRSPYTLKIISSVARRVVRVAVSKPSAARHGHFLDKMDPGPFTGTGFAVFIHHYFVIVSTNRHVIFDDEEASNSTIEFFADSNGTWDEWRKFEGVGVIRARSGRDFSLVVYRLHSASKDRSHSPDSVRQHKDLTPYCFPHLAYSRTSCTNTPVVGGCVQTPLSEELSLLTLDDSRISESNNPPAECVSAGTTATLTAATSSTTTISATPASTQTTPGAVNMPVDVSLATSRPSGGEVTETDGKTHVCVIAHPENLTKHVSFGEIISEDHKTRELRHNAPTRMGSSGAPILVFFPGQIDAPPDSIWYHCGQLAAPSEDRVARLHVNNPEHLMPEFNREFAGWRVLTDLLPSLEEVESHLPTGASGEGAHGCRRQIRESQGPPVESQSPSSVQASSPPSLLMATRLLLWAFLSGQALLQKDLREIRSSECETDALIKAFRDLGDLLFKLLDDDSIDGQCQAISFFTAAKALLDLHAACLDHRPCFCASLKSSEDQQASDLGPTQPFSHPFGSSETTLVAPQWPDGCVLMATVKLLTSFLSKPGVTIPGSLPELNLLLRIAIQVARLMTLGGVLARTRRQQAESGRQGAASWDASLLSHFMAVTADSYGSFLAIYDPWRQLAVESKRMAEEGGRRENSAGEEATPGSRNDVEESLAHLLQYESQERVSPLGFECKRPNSHRLLEDMEVLLEEMSGQRSKSLSQTLGQNPDHEQADENTKTMAAMTVIIGTLSCMPHDLAITHCRQTFSRRLQQALNGTDASMVRTVIQNLEQILLMALSIHDLAKEAWDSVSQKYDADNCETPLKAHEHRHGHSVSTVFRNDSTPAAQALGTETEEHQSPEHSDVTQGLQTPEHSDVTQSLQTPEHSDVTQGLQTPEHSDVTQGLQTPEHSDVTQGLQTPEHSDVTQGLPSAGQADDPSRLMGPVQKSEGQDFLRQQDQLPRNVPEHEVFCYLFWWGKRHLVINKEETAAYWKLQQRVYQESEGTPPGWKVLMDWPSTLLMWMAVIAEDVRGEERFRDGQAGQRLFRFINRHERRIFLAGLHLMMTSSSPVHVPSLDDSMKESPLEEGITRDAREERADTPSEGHALGNRPRRPSSLYLKEVTSRYRKALDHLKTSENLDELERLMDSLHV